MVELRRKDGEVVLMEPMLEDEKMHHFERAAVKVFRAWEKESFLSALSGLLERRGSGCRICSPVLNWVFLASPRYGRSCIAGCIVAIDIASHFRTELFAVE